MNRTYISIIASAGIAFAACDRDRSVPQSPPDRNALPVVLSAPGAGEEAGGYQLPLLKEFDGQSAAVVWRGCAVFRESYQNMSGNEFLDATAALGVLRKRLLDAEELRLLDVASQVEFMVDLAVAKRLLTGEISAEVAHGLVAEFGERVYSPESLLRMISKEYDIPKEEEIRLEGSLGARYKQVVTLAIEKSAPTFLDDIPEGVEFPNLEMPSAYANLGMLHRVRKRTLALGALIEYMRGGGAVLDDSREFGEAVRAAVPAAFEGHQLLEFSVIGGTQLGPGSVESLVRAARNE